MIKVEEKILIDINEYTEFIKYRDNFKKYYISMCKGVEYNTGFFLGTIYGGLMTVIALCLISIIWYVL